MRTAILALLTSLAPAPAPAVVAPQWSDTGRLVYQVESVAGDHTQTDLYTARPDGSGIRALTATPDQNEFGPDWRPDGTRLTFWRTPAPFGPGSVWTMDADGGHQRRLTTGIDARDPVYNPDGTRIAFTLVDADGWHLWTMRASDGGDRHRVTAGAALDFEPAWSPDGTRLAFTRGTSDGDVGDLCLVVLRTGAVRCLTATPDYDHQVAWAPDGRTLVFERDRLSSSSIWTVRADGTHAHGLTDATAFDTGPTYSPDGRSIAFGSDRGQVLGQLWTMTADGRQPRPVAAVAGSAGFPDWGVVPAA